MGRSRPSRGRRRRWATCEPTGSGPAGCSFPWPSGSSARQQAAQRAILQALPEAQQVCLNPNCKHRNPSWAKYCARCGCPLYLGDGPSAGRSAKCRAWYSLLWFVIVAAAAYWLFTHL